MNRKQKIGRGDIVEVTFKSELYPLKSTSYLGVVFYTGKTKGIYVVGRTQSTWIHPDKNVMIEKLGSADKKTRTRLLEIANKFQ